jgi:uncharacterized protein
MKSFKPLVTYCTAVAIIVVIKMIEIKLFGDKGFKGYTLVEAFPGIGLVGPMAGSYMIEKLEMENVGYISSEQFPPIASIHNAMPMRPARIYKSSKYKLLLFISEFTIPPVLVYQLADEILAFSRKYGISRIVSVGGMPSEKPTDSIYVTSADKDVLKKAVKSGIKPMEEGIVAGVSAALLVKSQEYGVEALDVMIVVDPRITDPKYAELAIDGLNKLLDIDIDLSELDKEAKEVEAKIRELLKKVKDTHDNYTSGDSTQETGPSMYA